MEQPTLFKTGALISFLLQLKPRTKLEYIDIFEEYTVGRDEMKTQMNGGIF
jgi:hypothetical protein